VTALEADPQKWNESSDEYPLSYGRNVIILQYKPVFFHKLDKKMGDTPLCRPEALQNSHEPDNLRVVTLDTDFDFGTFPEGLSLQSLVERAVDG
jgi:hypothetical protein